jgi:hypothetical protein
MNLYLSGLTDMLRTPINPMEDVDEPLQQPKKTPRRGSQVSRKAAIRPGGSKSLLTSLRALQDLHEKYIGLYVS